jgi:exopolyphosphatase/guanosine-5'-triphosphate,3'-diphosphate pyrophosphatase
MRLKPWDKGSPARARLWGGKVQRSSGDNRRTGPMRETPDGVGGRSGEPAGNANAVDRAQADQPPAGGSPVYAALDLGTNNCRLLVAKPSRRGFQVVDAFSRIIRLGEGLTASGRLSEAAMQRTIDALQVCADKLQRRGVARSRLIATEACRSAANGSEFLDRVKERTGLALEIVSRETEAKLAVTGCASLIDRDASMVLVFDIGGGSSELIWLDFADEPRRRPHPMGLGADRAIRAWTSLPVGVVTLSERFGGREVDRDVYEAMVAHVRDMLEGFEAEHQIGDRLSSGLAHLLGTSGTVTTVAGIHLALPAYDRRRVDGCWLENGQIREVSDRLIAMSYDERVAQPCIGRDRADLVLAGCAILEAILRMWPCERLRVADRGLREGMLATMMAEDGMHRPRRRRFDQPSGDGQ